LRLYEDLSTIRARLGILRSGILLAFAVLVASFWNLQVLRGRHFREEAERNRTRPVVLTAPRGPILDRFGRILVENRPSFNVILASEQSENLDDKTVARLAKILGVGEASIRERLARREGQHQPVVIRPDATLAEVAAVSARRHEFPEVSVEVVPLRSYPLAAAAVHALGRVGQVSKRQLEGAEFKNVAPGTLVGQAGLETRYNAKLMGEDGFRKVIVNSRGLEVGEAERRAPTDGPRMTLALDADLQAAMERAFVGRSGAGVVLDPATGEILAMTSMPAYDPNEFTMGVDADLWAQLVSDPATPLLNRSVQGTFAPGSTFKLVMAIAGLEEGVITPASTVYCPGRVYHYGTLFRCHREGGHGVVDLKRAIAVSCNIFFYELGVRLEIGRIARWARKLGLGAVTGVDLPHEVSGLVPDSEWKQRVVGAPWYAGETVSVAIGQGQVSVTPLQMARLAATIASGGRLPRPRLVRGYNDRPLPVCESDSSTGCGSVPVDLGIKPSTVAAVREGMRLVVAEGTGWRARLPQVAVCGKTGSAQVVAKARVGGETKPRIAAHGWFVGFAPCEEPKVAFSFIVEHGGSGGEAAAPVAHEVLSRYFGIETVQAVAPASTVQLEERDEER
jgi:penicillin-binding protein 2